MLREKKEIKITGGEGAVILWGVQKLKKGEIGP